MIAEKMAAKHILQKSALQQKRSTGLLNFLELPPEDTVTEFLIVLNLLFRSLDQITITEGSGSKQDRFL